MVVRIADAKWVKNGSWVMRSIILLLDVWWRGSPVTPRRLEKFCWKIAGVTRLTSYRAPGIVGCRRCLAWSIARGTRTSSLCLTLKYFIIFYPNDHRRLNDLKSVEKWRTLKLSWLPHETFKQMIEWANGWRVQFNTGEQFETRFQIDFRCSRIPIGMIPPFTFPLWNFS